jgi:hypothetical protein
MVIRLPKIKWNSFAVGAATSLVGGSILHPVLVSAARVGMGAASAVQDAWAQASVEMARVKAEAVQPKDGGANMAEVLAELRAMRSDLAAVKTKVGIA